MREKNIRKKIKIALPLGSALFFLLLILFGRSVDTLILLFFALFHEAGHATAAALCGVEIEKITLYPFGADMRLSSPLRSYGKDLFISSAGALANLLAAAVFFFFGKGPRADWAVACNLTLALTNLFPVEGLDGGGILRAALCLLFGEKKAETALAVSSFFGVVLMWAAAVYIFFVGNGDPSLFLLSCALFSSLFLRGKYRGKTE